MKLGVLSLGLIITSVLALEQEQFAYQQATEQDVQSVLSLINNIETLAQEYPWCC